MTPRTRLAWLGGYAVTTFLAFPHPVGERVIDLGWLLAWIAPACLLRGLEGLAPRRALGVGFLASLAAHTAVLHWIYVVTVVYGHAPVIAGIVGPIGLGAYIAAFGGLFAAGVAGLAPWLDRSTARWAAPWCFAALWTAVDHFRSFAFTGFPWATLGYAQHENAALLALAPFSGVYGLSFVSVLGGAALAEGVRAASARRAPPAGAGLALGAVLALLGVGAAIGLPEDEGLPTVRVAVLQGNIDQGVKWSPTWAGRTLEIYENLSRQAAARGAEVIVWPETAVPGGLDVDAELRGRLAELARETRATHVLGAVGIDVGTETRATRYYDSAFLLDREGRFRERYDKAHLVPFGEYVPLRDLLGRFLKAVARGIASQDVSPGTGPRALVLEREGGTFQAGVPICYELIFPDLVRRFADGGAEMLFGITNDAWYGRTGAPYQFLAMTALRSAETRLWTARAANTGVSAFIDAGGRVREQTPIFERGLLVADVPLRPGPLGGSFYTRYGDVFASACWLASAAFGAAAWRSGRRRARGG